MIFLHFCYCDNIIHILLLFNNLNNTTEDNDDDISENDGESMIY